MDTTPTTPLKPGDMGYRPGKVTFTRANTCRVGDVLVDGVKIGRYLAPAISGRSWTFIPLKGVSHPGAIRADLVQHAQRAALARHFELLAAKAEARRCDGSACSLSYGEGTRQDPDRCVHCGALFERDADTPFAMGEVL